MRSSSSSRWKRNSPSASRATRSDGRRSLRSPPSRRTSRGVFPPRPTLMSGADPGRPRPTDIVVTGLGAVTPFGWGVGPLWDGVRRGVSAVGPFTRFDASRHRTHLAAEVPVEDGGEPSSHHLSLADRFAVASAREAVAGAALYLHRCRERTGGFFGSPPGGMLEGEVFF